MPPDYVMVRFFDAFHVVMKSKYGYELDITERLPAELERIGFVSIQRRVVHVPIGFWCRDSRRMHSAFLFREVLGEFLPALQAKPFADAEEDTGLNQEQVDAMFAGVRAALCSRTVHAYIQFHFVWAQKPLR